MKAIRSIPWVALFSIAFAFVEASVVVYLRAIYYPEGFVLPLKAISNFHLGVELTREVGTMIMLGTIGVLAGRTRWERVSWFLIAFGVWDIFYYVWLKLVLDWPSSVFDWDILFLIPVPWIGPVIAPVLISLFLIIAGILIVQREQQAGVFRPPKLAWSLAVAGTVLILVSFLMDLDATLRLQLPKPYRYEFLVGGFLLYVAGMVVSFRRKPRDLHGSSTESKQ
jgi:hypothetical protein